MLMPEQRIEIGPRSAILWGDSALLKVQKLGIICSRRCSGDVILKTYDFARLVLGSALAIVSGFHSPIERTAFPSC
jgi:predicted Rossmann fold nucleotide-binding protein DprA/Smf involved in DNA uptake